MKKILSFLLTVVMLFSMVAGLNVTSSAAANPYEAYRYAKDDYGNWANCTWWAWQLAYDNTGVALPGWGNAGTWYNRAVNAGYSCGSTPAVNSIAVKSTGYYGHVQFVTAVDGNRIYVKEGGYPGTSNGYHEGWTTTSGVIGYIYCGSHNNNSPQGALDIVEGKYGEVFVRGWAFDTSNISQSIDIHVYIGADSAAAGGEGHAITANLERKDVNSVYGCGNKHGFSHTIRTNKTGSQTVYVYAINIGAGTNVLLGSKTINISNPNPIGSLDIVEAKCGAVFVRGWAYDPNDTSKSLDIHVYVGANSTAAGGEGHSIKADLERADVDRINSCGKNHGFSHTINTSKSGTQTVYVFAINIGSGGNVCLGYKTVSIKSNHSWNSGTTTKAATCTSTGTKKYTCTVCGQTKTETISKLTHKYKKQVISPTATTLGYTAEKCSLCGNEKNITSYTAPTGKVGGLKLKSRNDSSITVTWNKVSGVSGYQIQTCTKDGKKWSTYATLGAGTNTYTFKKLASGNNYKFRCRFFIKGPDGKTYNSPWCGTVNAPTLPKGMTLSKLTGAKKAFTAQWKKQSGVTGYQVQYSTSSKFTNAKFLTVKNNKTFKATIKNLSAKKTYYVRVRTYKTINKANYCSTWSKTYKVKTK